VIEADGGTRTAAITGGFVALALALRALLRRACSRRCRRITPVAAVSVGLVAGGRGGDRPVLDLPYVEDSRAAVDLNVVMLAGGGLVEVQGTGERGELLARRSSTRCSIWRSRASGSCAGPAGGAGGARRRETAGAGDGEPHKVGELAAMLAAAGLAIDVVAATEVGPAP
jgi:hypothetical protein